MWKLKVGEGGAWLMSGNNHVGRQHWEFDPDAGTAEERAEVDTLRRRFKSNRFIQKQSSDTFMRMQMRKEKESKRPIPEAIKVENVEGVTKEAVTTTLRRGIDYLSSIQAHDGHWPSESAGPLYFMPPLVGEGGAWLMSGNNHVGRQHWEFDPDAGTPEEHAEVDTLRRRFKSNRFIQKQSSDTFMRMQVMALYVTGGLNTVLPSEHQKEIKRYIYNHQNEDGGWGLHIEAKSCMFCSVLNYVALRLLGEGPDDGQNDAVSTGRKWILDHGGAFCIPSWGKFWISVIGLYEWDGCNPLPPESFLLPDFVPIHPGKIMCYCRLTYLPMSYLYAKRFVGKITPLIQQLRQELYTQPYHLINWNLARHTCAKEDLYYQHPLVQDVLWGFLYYLGEPILKFWPFSKLRENAIKVVMEYIHYEDINSKYLTIGCVEKVLCLLACWVEDPNSEAYKLHLARVTDYNWIAEDGMKMQGLATQMWEVTFASQAIMSSNLTDKYGETLRGAHAFIKASQMRENPSGNFEKFYRHRSKGGWGLSIQDHGWQVSDCTAEGLKVALLYSQMPKELVGEEMEAKRLYDAVDFMFTMQSESGGFPAWEPKRAYHWLENFNPTDFFQDVFIERDHVECTSSVIQALALFKNLHPTYRRQEVDRCIQRAVEYILDNQNLDGSWTGDWAICYLYGTWFAVDALTSCELKYNNSPALRRACEFLLSKQLLDGGWGESYLSCTKRVYTNLEGNRSNLVQTSWALLALIKAGQVEIDPTPIKNGVKLLINSQVEEDGDFPQQENVGVFYKTNALSYSTFRNIFPIWALGEYQKCVV